MKATRKKVDKITAALIAAHRRQEERPFPPGWRQQLMENIRSIGRPVSAPPENWRQTARPRRLLYMAAGALATIVVGLILVNLDWYDPYIKLSPAMTIVEKRAEFVLEAGDVDSGLRNLKVTVVQGGKEIELVSQVFKEPEGYWWSADAVKKVEIPVVLDPESLNLREGPATLKIAARDLSMRNGSKGRLTILQREIHIHRK